LTIIVAPSNGFFVFATLGVVTGIGVEMAPFALPILGVFAVGCDAQAISKTDRLEILAVSFM
jgi:hypothetical protein